MSRLKKISIVFLKFLLSLLEDKEILNIANKDLDDDIGGGGIKVPPKP